MRSRRARPSRGASASQTVARRLEDGQHSRRNLLAGAASLEVVAEAADGREVLGAVDLHRPDVVLMDIRMPELDGLQATRRILAEDNGARILMEVVDVGPEGLEVGTSLKLVYRIKERDRGRLSRPSLSSPRAP